MALASLWRKRSTPRTSTTRITRLDRAILAVRFAISGTVAVAAAVMSYQALAALSHRGHIADQWQWVWPVIVDGPHLAGALAVVAAQRRREPTTWGWFLLGGSTTASVAANVAAAPPDTLSRALHGAVPIVGIILVKDLCIGIRRHLEASAAAEEAPAAVAAEAPPVVTSVPDVDQPLTAAPPRPAAPPPPPEARPLRSVPASAPRKPKRKTTAGSEGRAIDRYAVTARQWMAEEPGITGAEIGRRLGVSDRYGRDVLAAANATA